MANQRRKDKVKVNAWMTDEEKQRLEELAKSKGFSSLTEFLQAVANGTVSVSVKLLIGLFLIAKLTHNPTDWSGGALATAAGTGLSWFGTGIAWAGSLAWQAGSALLGAVL